MTKQIVFVVLLVPVVFVAYIIFFTGSNKNNILQNKQSRPEIDTLTQEKNMNEQQNKMVLTSEAFENNEFIPKQHSYKDGNINPPLLINNVPEGTKSLALIVDDPDAPARVYSHWLVWNIPVNTKKIEEGLLPEGSIQGLNDFQKNEYDGPYPPSGTHRYFFKLYALDFVLNLEENSRKVDLENAMAGHILSEASLIGLYSKQ